jgi:excinuclease ABC subunit A
VQTIEMNFLPDVYVQCESCLGKRYNRETLEVLYKGKTINDVLNMTVDEAVDFSRTSPASYQKMKTLQEVGWATSPWGSRAPPFRGEAQRVKLAAELSRRDTGKPPSTYSTSPPPACTLKMCACSWTCSTASWSAETPCW